MCCVQFAETIFDNCTRIDFQLQRACPVFVESRSALSCLKRALELPHREKSRNLLMHTIRAGKTKNYDSIFYCFSSVVVAQIMTSTVREESISSRCDLSWMYFAENANSKISPYQARNISKRLLWPIFMIYVERLSPFYCLFAFACFIFRAINAQWQAETFRTRYLREPTGEINSSSWETNETSSSEHRKMQLPKPQKRLIKINCIPTTPEKKAIKPIN